MLGLKAQSAPLVGPRFDAPAGGHVTDTPAIKNPLILHAGPAFEVKFAGASAEAGTISGYISAYGPPADSYSDIVQRGAFDASLAEHRSQGSALPMLWTHDMARPCGKWTSFKSDDYGLHATGVLSLTTDEGHQAHEHLKAGSVSSLSIGYTVPPDGYQYQPDGTRLLLKVDLLEASIVPVGACRRARITNIKSIQNQRDLERFLHEEAGLPRRAAKAVANRGFAGIGGADEDEAALAELARRMDSALEEIRAFPKPYYYR
jgi:HK97 family phage prohead protease